MMSLDKMETNSITASEKAPHEGPSDPVKEANKKSKTQYFQFEDCHGSHPPYIDIPEVFLNLSKNSSESDKLEMSSLR